ncbi:MAG: SLC13 family permease, partial [Oceanospirillales bacterium]|nr:SLC13 family permease [Oceanospirillales bacterium]
LMPLEQGADFVNFVSLSLMSFVAALGVTLPGVPAVLTPMATDLAAQTGWSIETVLMTQVLGFSTVLFPYQSGPLLVSMQLAKEPISHLLRVTIPLTLITLLVLMPLDYLWWNLVGELG